MELKKNLNAITVLNSRLPSQMDRQSSSQMWWLNSSFLIFWSLVSRRSQRILVHLVMLCLVSGSATTISASIRSRSWMQSRILFFSTSSSEADGLQKARVASSRSAATFTFRSESSTNSSTRPQQLVLMESMKQGFSSKMWLRVSRASSCSSGQFFSTKYMQYTAYFSLKALSLLIMEMPLMRLSQAPSPSSGLLNRYNSLSKL